MSPKGVVKLTVGLIDNMKKVLALLGAVMLAVASFAAETIPAYLQDVSVTIHTSAAEGSGVIFTRTNAQGQSVNLIWTAGHVVSDLRSEREVIASDGSKRTVVEFKDAHIIKEILEDGRTVGRLELDAEVIRYSDADNGQDLAILRVRKQNFVKSSIHFYTNSELPALGTELYHVGSLLGQMGANSMTSGIYSQHGRLIDKTIFDQTTVAAFPGSSGGGVFLKDGEYVGMLVRGAGETFNLIVPVRRIMDWSKAAKVEWAWNPNVPMPSDDALKNLPIEDVGRDFRGAARDSAGASKSEYHTLIRKLVPEPAAENESSLDVHLHLK